jgi:hypothetical protein
MRRKLHTGHRIKTIVPVAVAIASAFGLTAHAGGSVDQIDKSAGGYCGAIHHALTNLAQAERDQALSLQLFSCGGQLAIVETRYRRLEQASGDLREILRRVRASRDSSEPALAECLKLGYQVLFAAEKVTSEVEPILIKAHGAPLVRLDSP